MDKNIINALAEEEVRIANYPLRTQESLFRHLIEPRKKDLQAALKLYESLSDEQVERRYCIHYWEDTAWHIYSSLRHESLDFLTRSIEPHRLAELEIKNVYVLLTEGKHQLMLEEDEDLYIEEMPSLYEKLLLGRWDDFMSSDELDAFEAAHEEHMERQAQFLGKFLITSGWKEGDFDKLKLEDKDEYNNRIDMFEQVIFESRKGAPRFDEYFNKDWVVSTQIQALVWYKEFLEKVKRGGSPFFDIGVPEESSQQTNRRSDISMKKLMRANDGYEAMSASFMDFLSTNGRKPTWQELMAYMVENQPQGFIVEASYEKDRLIAIAIEGTSINSEAFRTRYNRYFKNPEIKPDIS